MRLEAFLRSPDLQSGQSGQMSGYAFLPDRLALDFQMRQGHGAGQLSLTDVGMVGAPLGRRYATTSL